MKYVTGILAAAVVVLGLLAFAPKPPPPTVVAGAVSSAAGSTVVRNVWRFWSDGTVDISTVQTASRCDELNLCPNPPTVVVP